MPLAIENMHEEKAKGACDTFVKSLQYKLENIYMYIQYNGVQKCETTTKICDIFMKTCKKFETCKGLTCKINKIYFGI